MDKQNVLRILIGPESNTRLQEISFGLAPRLDYREVASRTCAEVLEWLPAASGLSGPRAVRLTDSAVGNCKRAIRLVGDISDEAESSLYSTGETWGLPVALAAAPRVKRRFTHVMYVHRVFSPNWLRFLHATRHLLAVDHYICVSREQARLLEALGGKGPLVSVISQGVDTKFFDPAEAVLTSTSPYMLSVGAEMRDYELLFEAVRDLDINVVVKASSTWMTGGRSQLRSIPANVTVLTRRLSYVELRELYAGARLVVTPLYDTPQAAGITTILESMAMGKCVVATQSSGLPDALIHGVTGRVVPASSELLRETLVSLWNDEVSRSQVASNAQDLVRAEYSIECHARAVVAVLAKTMRPRS